MCSVMVQNCPRTLAQASGELYFQTDSELSPMSPKYQKIYNMQYDDDGVCVCVERGEVRPPHSSNTSCSEYKN